MILRYIYFLHNENKLKTYFTKMTIIFPAPPTYQDQHI